MLSAFPLCFPLSQTTATSTSYIFLAHFSSHIFPYLFLQPFSLWIATMLLGVEVLVGCYDSKQCPRKAPRLASHTPISSMVDISASSYSLMTHPLINYTLVRITNQPCHTVFSCIAFSYAVRAMVCSLGLPWIIVKLPLRLPLLNRPQRRSLKWISLNARYSTHPLNHPRTQVSTNTRIRSLSPSHSFAHSRIHSFTNQPYS